MSIDCVTLYLPTLYVPVSSATPVRLEAADSSSPGTGSAVPGALQEPATADTSDVAVEPERTTWTDASVLHDAASALSGKKVLVVDDDVRNVFALTGVLERMGIEVKFARNGKDGIATLEATPDIDIVLMDIMMPGMDG